jgi:hypothetical protein
MEPGPSKDLLLGDEVLGGAVFGNGRVDREIGTLATAYGPSITFERVGAVTRERPLVVKGKDDGSESAQAWKHPEVEVASVEIVKVENAGTLLNRLRDLG